jgi:hypothetical protein
MLVRQGFYHLSHTPSLRDYSILNRALRAFCGLASDYLPACLSPISTTLNALATPSDLQLLQGARPPLSPGPLFMLCYLP